MWSVNLAGLFNTTAPVWADFAIPPNDPAGHLGILSTPVIDPSTHIMYVVACTLENSTMAYRLHAIDITTGAEPYGPGVLITGSYAGIMLGTPYLVQRTSLVLAGDQVVFGFGAMQVEHPLNYVGWVMAYDKRMLQQSGVFAPVITGNLQGGIWQSGRPLAVDSSGYVYVFTGNTATGGWNGTTDFSESALKLDPTNGLALVDWFTAGNWQYLDDNDLDLSSSGTDADPGHEPAHRRRQDGRSIRPQYNRPRPLECQRQPGGAEGKHHCGRTNSWRPRVLGRVGGHRRSLDL